MYGCALHGKNRPSSENQAQIWQSIAKSGFPEKSWKSEECMETRDFAKFRAPLAKILQISETSVEHPSKSGNSRGTSGIMMAQASLILYMLEIYRILKKYSKHTPGGRGKFTPKLLQNYSLGPALPGEYSKFTQKLLPQVPGSNF